MVPLVVNEAHQRPAIGSLLIMGDINNEFFSQTFVIEAVAR